jgi:hypothetical protein
MNQQGSNNTNQDNSTTRKDNADKEQVQEIYDSIRQQVQELEVKKKVFSNTTARR